MTTKYPALNESIEKTSSVLRLYDRLFIENLTKPPYELDPQVGPKGERYYYVYWPYRTGKDRLDGLRLIDNLGIVTIEEIFLVHGTGRTCENVGFTYRYINPYHTYKFKYNDGTTTDSGDAKSYSFHFDKSFIPTKKIVEPKEHIQVLHNVPRFGFEPGVITLGRFLDTIQGSCFDKEGESLTTALFSNAR